MVLLPCGSYAHCLRKATRFAGPYALPTKEGLSKDTSRNTVPSSKSRLLRTLQRSLSFFGELTKDSSFIAAQEGAFDEVVQGVQAIIHTASPFYFDATSVDGKKSNNW